MRIGINGNKFVATGDVALLAGHAGEAAATAWDRVLARPAPGGVASTRSPALAIMASDVPQLELGVGVVPVWGRHPAALAAQALTAAQGVPGGLTLGIGLSHPAMVAEHLGDLYGRPLTTMREYLEVLVPLVTSGTVDHDGDRFACTTDGRARRHGPADRAGSRRWANRCCSSQGDSPTAPSRPGRDRTRCATTSCPPSHRAAAKAGNPPRIASIFQVCVTDDVDRARETVHQWFEFHGKAPSYEAMLEREGVASASDVTIVGTEDDVRRRILSSRTSASPTSSSARCSHRARPTRNAPADSLAELVGTSSPAR